MKTENCKCCTCGYAWKKGFDGSHSCTEYMGKQIKALIKENRNLKKYLKNLTQAVRAG